MTIKEKIKKIKFSRLSLQEQLYFKRLEYKEQRNKFESDKLKFFINSTYGNNR